MEKLKYYFEFGENRLLPEEEQGFVMLSMITNADQSQLTNLIMSESVSGGRKKTSFDYASKSVAINKRHMSPIKNVVCPLTGQKYDSLTIDELYNMPQFNALYSELSEAIDDVNKLKAGLKKN